MTIFIAALLLALVDPTPTPVDSAMPSPAPTATPGAVRQLKLDIPRGWHRTESGQYNEWRNADETANFRVTPMGPSKEFQGPGAAEAVKTMFTQIAASVHPNPNVTVKTVSVCNGTQKAYRLDDPMGLGTPAFMMIIPGTVSTGLINYEIRAGNTADPAILAMLDKTCWP